MILFATNVSDVEVIACGAWPNSAMSLWSGTVFNCKRLKTLWGLMIQRPALVPQSIYTNICHICFISEWKKTLRHNEAETCMRGFNARWADGTVRQGNERNGSGLGRVRIRRSKPSSGRPVNCAEEGESSIADGWDRMRSDTKTKREHT